jgi:hypothetical protein
MNNGKNNSNKTVGNVSSRKMTHRKKKNPVGWIVLALLLASVSFLISEQDYILGMFTPKHQVVEYHTANQEKEAKSQTEAIETDSNDQNTMTIEPSKEEAKQSHRYEDYVKEVRQKNEGQIIPFTTADQTIINHGQLEYYIQIPKGAINKENFITLHFSHSPLLLENNSTLTVQFNEQPITSLFLSKDTEHLSTLEVPISLKELSPGFHKITIVFNGKIDDASCADNYDPANWFTLHRTSFFHLDASMVEENLYQLEDFPYPYVQVGRKAPMTSYVIIPNHADSDTMKAALKLAHRFYQESQRLGDVDIITEEELATKKEARHLIAIGHENDFSGIIKDILNEKMIKAEAEGMTLETVWLSELQRQLLYIGTSEKESMSSFIDVLTNPSFSDQLAGEKITISEVPAVRTSNVTGPPTFEELGINHMVLSSMSNVSPSIFYEIPMHWNVTDSGVLRLNMRISSLLQKKSESILDEHLGLTVHFNDQPFTIPFQTLIKQVDELGYVNHEVIIPRDILMNKGVAELQFSINLINQEMNCNRNDDSSRWIQINNTSLLDVPYVESEGTRLSDWPAPFVGNEDFHQVAFIIPNEVSGTRLSQVASLMNRLSSQLKTISNFIIIREEEWATNKEELKDYHFIVLKDHVKENDRATGPFLQETIEYMTQFEQSPINEDKVQITFASKAGANKDSPFFKKELLFYMHTNESNSSILVMSQSGAIVAGESTFPEESLVMEQTFSPLIWLGVLFAVSIVIVILLLLYFQKKKKKKGE